MLRTASLFSLDSLMYRRERRDLQRSTTSNTFPRWLKKSGIDKYIDYDSIEKENFIPQKCQFSLGNSRLFSFFGGQKMSIQHFKIPLEKLGVPELLERFSVLLMVKKCQSRHSFCQSQHTQNLPRISTFSFCNPLYRIFGLTKICISSFRIGLPIKLQNF